MTRTPIFSPLYKKVLPRRMFISLSMVFLICLSSQTADADSIKEVFVDALKAYQKNDFKESIELLNKTLKMNPNFAPAYNYLGLAHKQDGDDIQEVVWFFKQAIGLDSNYADPYENLGKIYYGLGDFDKAEKYTLEALRVKPDLATAQVSLGWIYLLGKSQPADAIKYFSQSIGSNPTPYGHFGLGMAYFMDHQNFRTLEMITALRKEGQDKLAEELEKMVRDKNYVPITPEGTPLIHPQNAQGSSPEDLKKSSPDFDIDASTASMPVRLRKAGGLPSRDRQSGAVDPANALSAQEQIRELQRRTKDGQNESGVRTEETGY